MNLADRSAKSIQEYYILGELQVEAVILLVWNFWSILHISLDTHPCVTHDLWSFCQSSKEAGSTSNNHASMDAIPWRVRMTRTYDCSSHGILTRLSISMMMMMMMIVQGRRRPIAMTIVTQLCEPYKAGWAILPWQQVTETSWILPV